MSRVDVTAPGGDYFRATGTVQDAVLTLPSARTSGTASIRSTRRSLGITTTVNGFGYGYLNGTSMSSPHAAGVAS